MTSWLNIPYSKIPDLCLYLLSIGGDLLPCGTSWGGGDEDIDVNADDL